MHLPTVGGLNPAIGRNLLKYEGLGRQKPMGIQRAFDPEGALGAGGSRSASDAPPVSPHVQQLLELARDPSSAFGLGQSAAEATHVRLASAHVAAPHVIIPHAASNPSLDRPTPPRDLKGCLYVPFDDRMTDFDGAPGDPSGRPTLVISLDWDGTIDPTEWLLLEASLRALRSDRFYDIVEFYEGDIGTAGLRQSLEDWLLTDFSLFYGVPSMVSGLADEFGLEPDETEALHKAIFRNYLALTKQPWRFGPVEGGRRLIAGPVLGSRRFFEGLAWIRHDLGRKGVDVIYVVVSNREHDLLAASIDAKLKQESSADVLDGAIGWNRGNLLGLEKDYKDTHNKKPNELVAKNVINTGRTEASKERVPIVNKARMTYMHFGDGLTDIKFANYVKLHNGDIGVVAVVVNTTNMTINPGELVIAVGAATGDGVIVDVLSHQVNNGGYSFDPALLDAGARQSKFPSQQDYRKPLPQGYEGAVNDALRGIFAEGERLLAEERETSHPSGVRDPASASGPKQS